MLWARLRVICGTRRGSLPLLPSGPGGVREHPSHRARSLTCLARLTFVCTQQTPHDGSTRLCSPSTLLAKSAASTVLDGCAIGKGHTTDDSESMRPTRNALGLWFGGNLPVHINLVVIDLDFEGGNKGPGRHHLDCLLEVNRSILAHDVE